MRSIKTTLAIVSGVAIASLLACSALLDLKPPPDQAPTQPTTDGSNNGCTTRYVSDKDGDDSNDGCSTLKPMKTIKVALGAFDTDRLPGYVIKVCSGTYAEDSLIVNLQGSLLGSFDCETFTHQAQADQPNGSTLTVANPTSSNKETMRVQIGPTAADAAADVTMVIDGFKIVGAAIPTSYAVHFITATPTRISNCFINGADTTMSRALYFTGNAAADVTANVIVSGSGTDAAAIDILGVQPIAPGPHIHGNSITGGSATSATDTIGSLGIRMDSVLLTAALGTAIEENVIITQSVSKALALGILVSRSTVDVIGNLITARGHILDAESSEGIAGIRAVAGATLRVLANRIYAGGALAGFGDFRGIDLQGAASVTIANNMIYGGSHQPGATQSGIAVGVTVKDVPNAMIIGNTIFTGYQGGGLNANVISVTGSTTGAVVENNILAGVGVNDLGIHVDVCPGSIASLRNNLFVANGSGPMDTKCTNGGLTGQSDISDLSQLVTFAEKNITLRTNARCSATDKDAGNCILDDRCADAGACVAAVIDGWGGDNGFSALDAGWHLTPTVSCKIARGGADLSKDQPYPLVTDYFGTARTGTPAIGATEVGDGGCL